MKGTLTCDQYHIDVHLHVPMSTFYSTQQVRKLHRQFAHPSSVKLYNLLRKAGLEAVTSNTPHQLGKIVAQCASCQRTKNAPYRFRVVFSQEYTRFNSMVYIDLMYIESDFVLHLVDEVARFSAAKFVGKLVTTEKVW